MQAKLNKINLLPLWLLQADSFESLKIELLVSKTMPLQLIYMALCCAAFINDITLRFHK